MATQTIFAKRIIFAWICQRLGIGSAHSISDSDKFVSVPSASWATVGEIDPWTIFRKCAELRIPNLDDRTWTFVSTEVGGRARLYAAHLFSVYISIIANGSHWNWLTNSILWIALLVGCTGCSHTDIGTLETDTAPKIFDTSWVQTQCAIAWRLFVRALSEFAWACCTLHSGTSVNALSWNTHLPIIGTLLVRFAARLLAIIIEACVLLITDEGNFVAWLIEVVYDIFCFASCALLSKVYSASVSFHTAE